MNPETVMKSEKIKILVVDDQAGMRLTLKGILSKKGYDVSVAQDGMAAVEAVQTSQFQVILMDIKMPGMSGVEAFIKIKQINPSAVVIMMTAFALEDEIKQAIREGAYAVIYKPFEMEKILGIIGECLEDRTMVLVVDDEVNARDMFRIGLEHKGYKVIEAVSGEECLKALKERRFQVILIDVKLPGIDGIETLKEVKKMRPEVGVIMVTGHSEVELIDQAAKLGSYRLLEKPMDINQLLDVVDQYVTMEGPKSRK